MTLKIYRILLRACTPLLEILLERRRAAGKEDPDRLKERMGTPSRRRPDGPLIWIHGASVGEAQSAMILVRYLVENYPDLKILMTTGTLTSAGYLKTRIPDPERVIHQFIPLDHPDWVETFLAHWSPDLAFWTESELWPNLLDALHTRHIPAILLNGRMSPRSIRKWRLAPFLIRKMLGAFDLILAQTEADARNLAARGARNVQCVGNLKFSADPLPCRKADLDKMVAVVRDRPCWLYASTHAGEEEIATDVHERLKRDFPDLLTVIVPRHPERGPEIYKTLIRQSPLKTRRRKPDVNTDTGANDAPFILPDAETDIYIADTLGELGLFYRLVKIACIGRSLSLDGGGGHNPLEAALLDCYVLHGPNIQNLQEIYDLMNEHHVAEEIPDADGLYAVLYELLGNPDLLADKYNAARKFAKAQSHVLDQVIISIGPYLNRLGRASGTS